MSPTDILSEFEHLVLLAVLQCGPEAFAIRLREVLEAATGRSISRGALYRSLDRLEGKGYVGWDVTGDRIPARGGHPPRRFEVTPAGMAALRRAHRVLGRMTSGLEELLEGTP